MDGYVDIDGHRFTALSGLIRLEIVDEYGFIAETVAIDIDMNAVLGEVPEILGRSSDDRITLDAHIDTANGTKHFSGYMDTIDGTLQRFEPPQNQLAITGRSHLSKMFDEGKENRITRNWENKDWSRVVMDLAQQYGFGLDYIESSTELAGERLQNGLYLLAANDETAGGIIQQAVDATGFLANVTAYGKFIFAPGYPMKHYSEKTFNFTPERNEGEIESLTFSDGAIDSFVVREDNVCVVPPGGEVYLAVEGHPRLSGATYVTKGRYVFSIDAGASIAEYAVVAELPDLKSNG